MGSESDSAASIEGEITNIRSSGSHWGKAKHDYYYTDYVDKDYPSKLTAKEERLASIEQEEALRIQKKLLSTLDNLNIQSVYEIQDDQDHANKNQKEFDLIDYLEKQNKSIDAEFNSGDANKKRKRVVFKDEASGSDDESFQDSEESCDENDDEFDDDQSETNDIVEDKKTVSKKQNQKLDDDNNRRRPINIAMKKNRGLTPYKKKEYRNPRVKHKNKYRRAMSKRRRNVKESQVEYHRYSGESNGIKTSTVKSIKLC